MNRLKGCNAYSGWRGGLGRLVAVSWSSVQVIERGRGGQTVEDDDEDDDEDDVEDDVEDVVEVVVLTGVC